MRQVFAAESDVRHRVACLDHRSGNIATIDGAYSYRTTVAILPPLRAGYRLAPDKLGKVLRGVLSACVAASAGIAVLHQLGRVNAVKAYSPAGDFERVAVDGDCCDSSASGLLPWVYSGSGRLLRNKLSAAQPQTGEHQDADAEEGGEAP
jgi:hypothetical protein